MGIVQMTVNLASGVTTVRVVGKMTADDLRFWVQDFYAGDVTSLVVWDLVRVDLSEMETDISDDEISAHVRQVNESAAAVRKGGKTAYVVGDNLPARRLCRMIESAAEAERSPFERRTFTDMNEARKWLGV